MTSKILVFGDPSGRNAAAAIAKAAQINASAAGPFDAFVMLGDVLSGATPEDTVASLADGTFAAPAMPTYFYLDRNKSVPDAITALVSKKDGKICENLTCVGSSGIVQTDKGVNIVLASASCGLLELEKLKMHKGAADVLITHGWPEHVDLLSASADKAVKSALKDARLTELALLFQPRYHFVPGNVFWEREPYKNEGFISGSGGGGERATRFISLAPFGNPDKHKWFYAFNISVPFVPTPLPANVTANPYLEASKQQANAGQANVDQLIWGTGEGAKRRHDDDHQSRRQRGRRLAGRGARAPREPRAVDPSNCFFCLSNPNLAQHFIVSIGDESYVTTAKGPLPLPGSDSLECPGHVLIIPLSHSPTISAIADEDSRKNTKAEMNRYRTSIAAMFAEHGYAAVAFEISRYNGIHFHIQVIPVPIDKLDSVKPEFETAAQVNGYTITEREEDPDKIEEEDYFKVYLDGNRVLHVPLAPEARFDLQFGRKVLAAVLGLPDRVDWRSCAQDEADEAKDAERFKALFGKHDFTV